MQCLSSKGHKRLLQMVDKLLEGGVNEIDAP